MSLEDTVGKHLRIKTAKTRDKYYEAVWWKPISVPYDTLQFKYFHSPVFKEFWWFYTLFHILHDLVDDFDEVRIISSGDAKQRYILRIRPARITDRGKSDPIRPVKIYELDVASLYRDCTEFKEVEVKNKMHFVYDCVMVVATVFTVGVLILQLFEKFSR